MPNIGFPELILILIIALLIFGPKKLPEIGKSIGKAISELKRASNELKETIEDEIRAEEIKKFEESLESEIGRNEEEKAVSRFFFASSVRWRGPESLCSASGTPCGGIEKSSG
ncbi:MAG: TatA/E family twin arginine-targeting protein translocase [Firmicutes bacterium]|nr:TatA/E family twin arginine-targeting protein translocase [Bacillota bacterium]